MDELIFDISVDISIDEGGRFLAIGRGDSIFTDGASLEDLRANIREVVEAFYFDRPRPASVRLHIVHDEMLSVA